MINQITRKKSERKKMKKKKSIVELNISKVWIKIKNKIKNGRKWPKHETNDFFLFT